jgi:hypothetical protein
VSLCGHRPLPWHRLSASVLLHAALFSDELLAFLL